MFVFNEGVPRAGKSYNALEQHILPAIKQRRTVFARLNGMEKPDKRAKIAEYCGVTVEELDELLIHVPGQDVLATFVAVRNEAGEWAIPDKFKDALVVIDEVHQFYVTGRAALPPEQEEFFALLGQNGGDAVILTQSIKRVHPAVRARIEKKNSMQKLEALGMEGRYVITHYQTLAPDKYEKIGSTRGKYLPAIYAMYDGYADGSENRGVYKGGSLSLLGSMKLKLLLAAAAVAFGIYGYVGFFKRGQETKEPVGEVRQGEESASATVHGRTVIRPAGPAPAEEKKKAETVKQKAERERDERVLTMPAAQRYVIGLEKEGRVRLAARMGVGKATRIVLEWIDDQGTTLERLSGKALEDMGFVVEVRDFGVLATAGAEAIVATAWPLQRIEPIRPEEDTLYNTAGPQGVAGLPSEASQAATPGVTSVAFGKISNGGTGTMGYGVDASPR